MILFFFKFFITNFVFSLILCSLLIRLNAHGRYSNSEIMLYSLGLGPAFTSLLLYHSFLIVPHHSNAFYLILIIVVYVLLAFMGRKSLKFIYRDVLNDLKRGFALRGSLSQRSEHIILLAVVVVPLVVYLFYYVTRIVHQPLIGHDILNYGIMGRILFEERSLAPIWLTNFAKGGFSYDILHPPSFSLILTWEELMNSPFHIKSDLYFKSISAYYGLLIVGVQFYWLSKQSKWLAALAAFVLLSAIKVISV